MALPLFPYAVLIPEWYGRGIQYPPFGFHFSYLFALVRCMEKPPVNEAHAVASDSNYLDKWT